MNCFEHTSSRFADMTIDRMNLAEKGYEASLMKDHAFKGSRLVMDAKRKNLKHEGLGRKPNRAQFITEEEEEVLWSTGQLGPQNAVSLQNTLWWRNNFFGLRGRQEHRAMRWGDLVIQTDTSGLQYIEYHERDTKTRKDPKNERPFLPKLFATPNKPERCPVQMLLLFTHKRPMKMLDPESPFYLTPLPANQMKPDTWYKQSPLGMHSLGDIMKKMCQLAGLPGKLTNHSGRKTTVKRLREAGVESTDIVQLTGHKNVQSVNSYSSVSIKKQMEMSTILVNPESKSKSNEPKSNPLPGPPTNPGTITETSPYEFDPNDGFDNVLAHIEQYENPQPLPTCNDNLPINPGKTLMPNSAFNNCTFNFSINYNN